VTLQMVELVCARQNWKETEHLHLLNDASLDLSHVHRWTCADGRILIDCPQGREQAEKSASLSPSNC
jgi:hypothetical protein